LDLPEKLERLCDLFNIKRERAHDALEDASATLRVWQRLKTAPMSEVWSSNEITMEITKR
jgi:DNA polymerase III epsilon subunit-like protein